MSPLLGACQDADNRADTASPQTIYSCRISAGPVNAAGQGTGQTDGQQHCLLPPPRVGRGIKRLELSTPNMVHWYTYRPALWQDIGIH